MLVKAIGLNFFLLKINQLFLVKSSVPLTPTEFRSNILNSLKSLISVDITEKTWSKCVAVKFVILRVRMGKR